ncbi:high mobility group protein B2 isoform X1 [Schistocerca nitens]|uniref:high mobility group protein B2 isoform X1 n=1 Tax=Schistocerca nitens TaxID=7011 RepID=UPI0021191ACF|nr:high mobility group protein B2 isoform X1 [Schistocerca nitens]
MIVPPSNAVSDDSEDDVENAEVDIYRRKYQLLLERCEVLQQDNERLVHRIQHVKKMLRRYRRDRKFLMDCLDQHGDNWRNAYLQLSLDEPSSSATVKTEKHQSKNIERTPSAKGTAASEKISRKSGNSSTGKRKGTKHADPNAPKRPANPFLQFCQEQRPIVMERLGHEQKGEAETSRQELTRQLASRWNTLPAEDKKVYYDMYEKSKEKYAAEMQMYAKRTQTPVEDDV